MSMFTKMEEIWGYDMALDLLKRAVGRSIFGEVREKGKRVFIRSLSETTNIEEKDGWWSVFSLCNQECDPGFYIFKIIDLKWDKDGNPIFILNRRSNTMPKDTILLDEIKVLCGVSNDFIEGMRAGEYNFSQLGKVINLPSEYEYKEIARKAIKMLISGTLTVEEVVNALNEPDDYEKEMKRRYIEYNKFLCDLNHYSYPYLYKYADKNGMVSKAKTSLFYDEKGLITYYDADRNVITIEGLHDKYENAVRKLYMDPVNGSIFDQIEAYLSFDNDRKAKNKAAKKAAKKAKKA